MSKTILSHNKNGSFSGMVSQSVTINASVSSLWKEIGNFIELSSWVLDVKKTELLSKIKNDIGAARKITFADGSTVIEYAVGWKERGHLSYIATSGLPLDGYHATLSITPKGKSCGLMWSSFLISQDSDKKKFEEFLAFMELFYAKSLETLKENLEKAT
ncbi:MAG: SRPBCC family protein [Nitrososphaerota archaeon]|nr:SRPBCC family protein [Nitrososphaerota archaeon]